MNIKGAIFDLDGTILDSMGVWDSLPEKYLIQKGCVPAKDLDEKLKPMTLPEAARYFCSEYGIDESEEDIVRHINRLIEYEYVHSLQFKDSVRLFLQKLKERGAVMCIATATDRPLVEAALERLGIAVFFRGIVTCYDTGCGKDRPDIYLKALELLGTSIDETIVFEDALHAVKTAKAAGFKVAAVFDESSLDDREELMSAADWYLNSFDEFPFSS